MSVTEYLKRLYYQLQSFINRQEFLGRFAILLCFLLAILLFWLLLLFLPIHKETAALVSKLKAIQVGSEITDKEINGIIEKITGRSIELQKKELGKQEEEAEKYLNLLENEVIPPSKMSSVLRDVLLEKNHLTLTGFNIYPKQTLVAGKEKTDPPLLYKQDVQFTFTGGYFDTLQYLQHLEGLEWRFFWDDIEYNVYAYPKATVKIKLHTLGKS